MQRLAGKMEARGKVYRLITTEVSDNVMTYTVEVRELIGLRLVLLKSILVNYKTALIFYEMMNPE